MAGLELNVTWKKRIALYRPNKWRAKQLGVIEGVALDVDVLGLYQCSDDDGPIPYFVVELSDGTCHYADITEIQFMDKEATQRC